MPQRPDAAFGKRVYNVLVTRLAVLLLLLTVATIAAADLRILCIGDSITHGRAGKPDDAKVPPTYSYRYPLWKKLIDAGVKFRFVGGHEGGFEGAPEYATYKGQTFPNVHEAYWGWTTAAVLGKLREHRDQVTADIAIILIGGNDDQKKNGFEPTIAAMRETIAFLRERNPRVKILLGRLFMEWEPNPELGERYAKLAKELSTKASPIVDVVTSKGWVSKPDEPNTATVDWVHPNPHGDELLAEAFFRAMQPWLSPKRRS